MATNAPVLEYNSPDVFVNTFASGIYHSGIDSGAVYVRTVRARAADDFARGRTACTVKFVQFMVV